MPEWSWRRWAPARGPAVIVCCVVMASSTGCGGLRLYDAGRLKTASEAKDKAADISGTGGAVFGPMEENLDAVRDTQKALRDLSNKHRFETYQAILAQQSADDLAGRVAGALSEHVNVTERIDRDVEDAAAAVNEALDREAAITRANNEAVGNKKDLKETLSRLKSRLDWIQKVVDSLDRLDGLAGKAGLAGAVPSMTSGDKRAVDDLIAKATAAIGQIDSDERVTAAVKLLQQAVQEVAGSEQARVLEMKRHLAELARLRDNFIARDRISICTLFEKTVAELHPALTTEKQPFEQLVAGLADRYPCLGGVFKGAPANWKITTNRIAQVQADWGGKTLAGFVASDIKKRGADATAPRLVAALGVLLFHDREYYETVRWDLAREHHRHSVRLSKANAQERVQLVHQLTQALEVYYQGGVKPEEVAQLLLMAGQVGALAFIGARQ